jgi:hypothetical protein
LFERGSEVVADFLSENVRIGEVVELFEAFVSEPEDIEAGFVAVKLEMQKSERPLFFSRFGFTAAFGAALLG